MSGECQIPLSADMLREEIRTLREQGAAGDALDRIERDVAALPDGVLHDDLEALYRRLEAVEPDPALAEREPTDLEAIRRLRPDGPRRMDLAYSEETLLDRLLGAWLARAAGCTLGKPVEGWTRQEIRALLECAGEYPLRRFFPPVGQEWSGKRYHGWQLDCLRGNIQYMARDDDMDYTLLGLVIMEAHGPGFTTRDVAEEWLNTLPYHRVYTAETVAYRNLVLGIQPPATATVRNPYREWIGAQIRADFWGYAAAGLPELAAEFAWRDAVLSHTRNGVYGEMWMAATIAAAFTVDDAEQAIRIGLSEIPAECRLARALRNTVSWCREDGDLETTLDRIQAEFGHYHPVHTVNNAALVVAGLMYGHNSLAATISSAVTGGWDTDCNGASAGSVFGAMYGANVLPYEWVGCLNDTLHSALSGIAQGTPHRFTDLAQRTLVQHKQLAARLE
ncbi:MAG: ADP-ribosylglycohydrolase [Candidatus Latescibacteria bacterium ADurb.Bin168]|nr:MAG: ADP-ribosylglycohydrolase [Candidatus Latescibacteria bacterium ADurb.Bin168]